MVAVVLKTFINISAVTQTSHTAGTRHKIPLAVIMKSLPGACSTNDPMNVLALQILRWSWRGAVVV